MVAMTPGEATSQQLSVPVPGSYRIDAEHSTVTIRTRHLFGLGPVRATLALRDGRVRVAATPGASTAAASFAVSTFRSGNADRDSHVLSPRLLDAEAYPGLTFTSTELVAAQGRWTMRGELEVRGVTRLVEVRLRAVSEQDGTLRATADAVVDRCDFGITAYRGLAARRLTVELAVTAHRESRS